MIVEITPLRATAIYKALATSSCTNIPNCCYAVLTFNTWGQVATNHVCPIYQLSSDGLAAAVEVYIDLSDLTPHVITSKPCSSLPPIDGSCMISTGTYSESDLLYSLEVYCMVGEEMKKYLGIYDINKPYFTRPIIRVVDTYAVDKSLNPGYINIDPSASILSRGIFSGIFASVKFSTGETISNIPVEVSSGEIGQHLAIIKLSFSIPTTPSGYITDISFFHESYGVIGELTNLLLPAITKMEYTSVINTQIAI